MFQLCQESESFRPHVRQSAPLLRRARVYLRTSSIITLVWEAAAVSRHALAFLVSLFEIGIFSSFVYSYATYLE